MADYNSSHTGEQIDSKLDSFTLSNISNISCTHYGGDNGMTLSFTDSNNNKYNLNLYVNGMDLQTSSDGGNSFTRRWGATITNNWSSFVSQGMGVEQVILNFSGGSCYYTFNRNVLLVGANAVGSDYPICFSRTSGYTQYLFHLVHPNQYTMDAAIIVDLIYINL